MADMIADTLPTEADGSARRHREVLSGTRQVVDVIAAKALHGWLQNRHQTLMPLSVNLRQLEPEARAAVAGFAGMVTRAGGRAATEDDPLLAWLVSVGADEAFCAAYRQAVAAPPPLPDALEAVQRHALSSLAYVTAIVAARGGDRPSRLFAEYLAARLEIPSAAVWSALRRYGF